LIDRQVASPGRGLFLIFLQGCRFFRPSLDYCGIDIATRRDVFEEKGRIRQHGSCVKFAG